MAEIDYSTDDYPRVGCVASVDVQADGYALRITDPTGRRSECYAKVRTPQAIGRMVEAWCAGAALRLDPGELPGAAFLAFRAVEREAPEYALAFMRFLVTEVCGQEWSNAPPPHLGNKKCTS